MCACFFDAAWWLSLTTKRLTEEHTFSPKLQVESEDWREALLCTMCTTSKLLINADFLRHGGLNKFWQAHTSLHIQDISSLSPSIFPRTPLSRTSSTDRFFHAIYLPSPHVIMTCLWTTTSCTTSRPLDYQFPTSCTGPSQLRPARRNLSICSSQVLSAPPPVPRCHLIGSVGNRLPAIVWYRECIFRSERFQTLVLEP